MLVKLAIGCPLGSAPIRPFPADLGASMGAPSKRSESRPPNADKSVGNQPTTVTDTRLRTPVSLVYHSLDDVNEKLRLGRYFFMDILRDGVVLFEEEGALFVEPQPLTAEEALAETRAFFDQWFEGANSFIRGYHHAVADGDLNKAAFDLHQATERLYLCLFLVRTLYTPKTHNLNRLRSLAEDMEARLKQVWPASTKEER